MGRFRLLVLPLAVALAALLLPAAARAYGWPLAPFDRQQPVRGFLNDPRRDKVEGALVESFHSGIDIAAPDGTAVYAVAPGKAFPHREYVAVVGRDGRTFGYWHIIPALARRQRVAEHQLIGHIAPGWGHVHFSESRNGVYFNPLRPRGIEPYTDTTSPTIAGIRISAEGQPVDAQHVGGTVDLIVEAFDTPPLALPPPWERSRLTPGLVRWRLLRDGSALIRWRTAVDLRSVLLPAPLFDLVYAPCTRQNRANHPGFYCFYLAPRWDTSRLPGGSYRLEVEAVDLLGNSALASFPLTIGGGRARAEKR